MLDEIKKRLEAATPGPWESKWDTQRFQRDGYPWSTFAIGPMHGIPEDPSQGADKVRYLEVASRRNADADLIAHAPTDIAALLAEVARLREDAKKIQDEPELFVYRVYNGWVGACAEHRIVIAKTSEDAATLARALGEKWGRVTNEDPFMEYVGRARDGFVESEDYHG